MFISPSMVFAQSDPIPSVDPNQKVYLVAGFTALMGSQFEPHK